MPKKLCNHILTLRKFKDPFTPGVTGQEWRKFGYIGVYDTIQYQASSVTRHCDGWLGFRPNWPSSLKHQKSDGWHLTLGVNGPSSMLS